MLATWLLGTVVGVMLHPAADPLAAETQTAAGTRVPYRLTDTKHVLVRVKINDQGPFNLILDTGAPAVFLTEKIAKKTGIETDDRGWAKATSFVLEGGLKVPDAQTRVADLFQLEGMNGMGLAGVELHGVIGYNVLAKYRITYDFTRDKLLFVPLQFKPPAPLGGSKSNSQGSMDVLGPAMKLLAGFMGIKPNFTVAYRGSLGVEVTETDGQIRIEQVYPESAAARAGLQVGDRILGYGAPGKGRRPRPSEPEELNSLKELQRYLAKVQPGDVALFQVERGDARPILQVTFGKGL